jgi:hypothetical protein
LLNLWTRRAFIYLILYQFLFIFGTFNRFRKVEMALRNIKSEHRLRYSLNGKKARRQSSAWMKKQHTRSLRRKIKGNIEFVPVFKQMKGHEF